MASYGNLLRKITTAEINRIQREGNYSRWAYFIDESTAKVGVVFANDTTFAAYTVPDEPDPKLQQYGVEPIKGLTMTPDQQFLVLAAGDNLFQAVVFTDLLTVLEDDFLPNFSYAAVGEWQQFLRQRHVKLDQSGNLAVARKILTIIIIAVVAFVVLGIITNNLAPGFVTGDR